MVIAYSMMRDACYFTFHSSLVTRHLSAGVAARSTISSLCTAFQSRAKRLTHFSRRRQIGDIEFIAVFLERVGVGTGLQGRRFALSGRAARISDTLLQVS